MGGPFFWHRRWDLPSPPDVVTSAKKCQVGAVVSRWPAPEPWEASVVSALRGALYADLVSEGAAHCLEELVTPRLEALREAHPELVLNPRAVGYSFVELNAPGAFRVPDAQAPAMFSGRSAHAAIAIYYSFVTLSTLGYGDVTPVSHLARLMSPHPIGDDIQFLVVIQIKGVFIALSLFSNIGNSGRFDDHHGSLYFRTDRIRKSL